MNFTHTLFIPLIPQYEQNHKTFNKKMVKNAASFVVHGCQVLASDVYSDPEEEEHGAQSHEDGGNQRDEDLLDELSRELGRCDFVDEEPAGDTDLNLLLSRYQSRISLVNHSFASRGQWRNSAGCRIP